MGIIRSIRVKYYRYKISQIHKFTASIYFPLDYLSNKEKNDLSFKLKILATKLDYYQNKIKKLSSY